MIQSSLPSCRLLGMDMEGRSQHPLHLLADDDRCIAAPLTLDTGTLDDLNVLETREDIAADAEADLDAVLDSFLDGKRVLFELSQLLFGLLKVDRHASVGRC